MKRIIGILTTILILSSIHIDLSGQTYPDSGLEAKLVNDFTDILTLDETDALEIKLLTFYDSASIHIVVVIVSDIGKRKISDYARGLYNEWGLGELENSKGILLLIQTSSPAGIRRAFIEPDSDLKNFIPEDVAASIINHELIPDFKRGRRFTALSKTTDVLISLASGEYSHDQYEPAEHEGSNSHLLRYLLAAIAIVLLIRIWLAARRK